MDAAALPGDDLAQMLRDSLRGFLGEHWKADCLRDRPAPRNIAAIWSKLVGQGVAALGCNRDEGGLREVAVVLGELGRAGCPAPMWSAALANFALATARSPVAVDLLRELHEGSARVAFSFGAIDPDQGAGSIRISDGHVVGLLRFVEAAGGCTHLLVAVDRSTLAVVALESAGVGMVPTRAMGAWGHYEVRLSSVPAALVPVEEGALDELLLKAKLALIARALP
jgi:hypothetical protein